MSRQRSVQIQESLEHLARLEQHYRGEPEGARIKVLRLLKEDANRTIEHAASLAGCSERSVYRWWNLYLEQGINAVLGSRRKNTAQSNRIGRDEIEELAAQLRVGELSTLNDVQSWLEQRFGVQYSLKGVANLLQRRLKAKRVWLVPEGDEARGGEVRSNEVRMNAVKSPKTATDTTVIPDKVVHFLNRLPLTSDTQKAVDGYREALMKFLGDVDRVSLYINIRCDLMAEPPVVEQTQTKGQQVMITVDATVGKEGISVASHNNSEDPSQRILENLQTQGVRLDEHHTPVTYDYYYRNTWLGAIFLWRDRTKTPISQRTRDMVALLEPFIVYMLSDLVARHNYAHPADRLLHDALEEMMRDGGLTMQERRVVTFRLLGHAYKEIADKLNITEDAIKKHLSSVHRKTGTRSYTELFAKYFTPRLNLKEV